LYANVFIPSLVGCFGKLSKRDRERDRSRGRYARDRDRDSDRDRDRDRGIDRDRELPFTNRKCILGLNPAS
jgi:hypothetical protein